MDLGEMKKNRYVSEEAKKANNYIYLECTDKIKKSSSLDLI